MTYALTVTETATPAVPLKDIKRHLNIDYSDDDTLLTDYILTATRDVEHDTNRSFINKTYVMKLDCFPSYYTVGLHNDIVIPVAPLSSVTSITYVDENEATQTWASSKYTVDTSSEPARVEPAYQETYPSTLNINNAVTVTFVAGYGTSESSVPVEIQHIIKMLVSEYWMHREFGCMSDAFRLSYESMIRRHEYTFYA